MNDQIDPRQVMDGLGTDARILIQARRLPVGKLTEEQIDAVRTDYRTYVTRNSIFDATAAKETGLSQAVISQFRSNTYQKGDNSRVAHKLNNWMELDARRRKSALPTGYVHTQIAEEIKSIVATACASDPCKMAAIVAPSGSGKTMLLKVLAEEYNGRYLRCCNDMTPKVFLVAIAELIGIIPKGKGKYQLITAIVDKLNGTNRPLFLDEAHLLPADVLPRIRTIYDMANIPFIMAGTAEIHDRVNDRSDGLGQLASRCLLYSAMELVMDADDPNGSSKRGRPLFSQEEIRAFLENLPVRFDKDAFLLVWAIACLPNHGCLREALNLVQVLSRLPNLKGREVTRKQVRAVLDSLRGNTGRIIGRAAERHLEFVAASA